MECNFRKQMNKTILFLFFTLPLISALKVDFYSKTCPKAETIVQQTVKQRFTVDKTVTAALVRMHFHDCFVRGCDASILINSTKNSTAEKDAGANGTVREYTLIDQIKSKLESSCNQTVVSCADIIALATRDAIALSGGPKYNVPTGRRDGLRSSASDVNLPGPGMTVTQAQKAFSDRGLDLKDMVSLLGGHTVGVAHCNFFQNRVIGTPDSTMDKTLAKKLKSLCENSNSNPSTFLDQNTSFTFDNEYYNQIRKNKGVLKIDQELALDSKTSKMVSDLGGNNDLFKKRFANAMIRMGRINVLEGTAGEIRKKCGVFNKKK